MDRARIEKAVAEFEAQKKYAPLNWQVQVLVDLAKQYLTGTVETKAGERIRKLYRIQKTNRAVQYEILFEGMVIALCPSEEISLMIINSLLASHIPQTLKLSKIELLDITHIPMQLVNRAVEDKIQEIIAQLNLLMGDLLIKEGERNNGI